MVTLDTILSRVLKFGSMLAGAGLVGAMLLVTVSVTARFFSAAISGSYELTQLLISVTIVFALAYTGLHGGHIVVEIVVRRFRPSIAGAAGILVSVLTVGFWLLVAWAGARFALDTGLQEVSETLGVPFFPFRMMLALGAFLLALSYISNVAEAVRKMRAE